jgi:hypothetical protein
MILGVAEGEQVSYSEIQKNLHKYIKNNDLKNPLKRPSATQPPAVEKPQPFPPSSQQQATQPEPIAEALAGGRYCRSCGAHIPSDAVFCDMCGFDQ